MSLQALPGYGQGYGDSALNPRAGLSANSLQSGCACARHARRSVARPADGSAGAVRGPGVPHHVTQRGNGRQRTFFGEADYAAYRELLRVHCAAQGVAVWSYGDSALNPREFREQHQFPGSSHPSVRKQSARSSGKLSRAVRQIVGRSRLSYSWRSRLPSPRTASTGVRGEISACAPVRS